MAKDAVRESIHRTIVKLRRRLGRTPTVDEVWTFIKGTRDEQEAIWNS